MQNQSDSIHLASSPAQVFAVLVISLLTVLFGCTTGRTHTSVLSEVQAQSTFKSTHLRDASRDTSTTSVSTSATSLLASANAIARSRSDASRGEAFELAASAQTDLELRDECFRAAGTWYLAASNKSAATRAMSSIRNLRYEDLIVLANACAQSDPARASKLLTSATSWSDLSDDQLIRLAELSQHLGNPQLSLIYLRRLSEVDPDRANEVRQSVITMSSALAVDRMALTNFSIGMADGLRYNVKELWYFLKFIVTETPGAIKDAAYWVYDKASHPFRSFDELRQFSGDAADLATSIAGKLFTSDSLQQLTKPHELLKPLRDVVVSVAETVEDNVFEEKSFDRWNYSDSVAARQQAIGRTLGYVGAEVAQLLLIVKISAAAFGASGGVAAPPAVAALVVKVAHSTARVMELLKAIKLGRGAAMSAEVIERVAEIGRSVKLTSDLKTELLAMPKLLDSSVRANKVKQALARSPVDQLPKLLDDTREIYKHCETTGDYGGLRLLTHMAGGPNVPAAIIGGHRRQLAITAEAGRRGKLMNIELSLTGIAGRAACPMTKRIDLVTNSSCVEVKSGLLTSVDHDQFLNTMKLISQNKTVVPQRYSVVSTKDVPRELELRQAARELGVELRIITGEISPADVLTQLQ